MDTRAARLGIARIKDVPATGLASVDVIGPDEYRLDGDHDGLGCE